MPTVQKLCCICGKDVAAVKRVKDQRGRYYCEPCARRANQAAPPRAPAPASAPPPAPDPDDLDLAPLGDDASKSTPMAACSHCKKLLPERQVRYIDGEFICNACASQRQQPQRSAPARAKPAAKAKAQSEEQASGEPGFADSLLGGGLISAGVLAASYFVFFALYQFYAEPGIEGTVACAIAAFVRSVILLFSTGGLILSMIVAARILGGISFGFLGPVLYKSILFCLGIAVMDYCVSHFESLELLAIAFRFALILGALIALFKIDMFEAFLLAIINTGLSWVLAIVMVMFLVIFGAAIERATDRSARATDEPDIVLPADEDDMPLTQPNATAPANLIPEAFK
jgi:hypothetical protein